MLRDAILVDDDDFAGLDVADKFGVDQIERAGFAGEHPGITDFANAKRPETVRIAHADQFLLRHDDERISAFDPADALRSDYCRARSGSAGPSDAE